MRKATHPCRRSLPLFRSLKQGLRRKGDAKEVVHKIRQAASYLAQEKEAGLATFKQEQSDYVWADTYVFVAIASRRSTPPIR